MICAGIPHFIKNGTLCQTTDGFGKSLQYMCDSWVRNEKNIRFWLNKTSWIDHGWSQEFVRGG